MEKREEGMKSQALIISRSRKLIRGLLDYPGSQISQSSNTRRSCSRPLTRQQHLQTREGPDSSTSKMWQLSRPSRSGCSGLARTARTKKTMLTTIRRLRRWRMMSD
jgi:hypothetical protein